PLSSFPTRRSSDLLRVCYTIAQPLHGIRKYFYVMITYEEPEICSINFRCCICYHLHYLFFLFAFTNNLNSAYAVFHRHYRPHEERISPDKQTILRSVHFLHYRLYGSKCCFLAFIPIYLLAIKCYLLGC